MDGQTKPYTVEFAVPTTRYLPSPPPEGRRRAAKRKNLAPPPALTPNTDTHINHPDPSEPESAPQADLIYLSDTDHRPIEWLWQDRPAACTLAMLSGDPGSGKTWVVLAIAAALSLG
jgi:hypothetical protein